MKLIAGFSETPSCCCGEGLRDHGGSGDQLGGGCRVQAETVPQLAGCGTGDRWWVYFRGRVKQDWLMNQ